MVRGDSPENGILRYLGRYLDPTHVSSREMLSGRAIKPGPIEWSGRGLTYSPTNARACPEGSKRRGARHRRVVGGRLIVVGDQDRIMLGCFGVGHQFERGDEWWGIKFRSYSDVLGSDTNLSEETSGGGRAFAPCEIELVNARFIGVTNRFGNVRRSWKIIIYKNIAIIIVNHR